MTMSDEDDGHRTKVVQIVAVGHEYGDPTLYALTEEGVILEYEPATFPGQDEGDPPSWKMIEPPVFGRGGNVKYSYDRQKADWDKRSEISPNWRKTKPPSIQTDGDNDTETR